MVNASAAHSTVRTQEGEETGERSEVDIKGSFHVKFVSKINKLYDQGMTAGRNRPAQQQCCEKLFVAAHALLHCRRHHHPEETSCRNLSHASPRWPQP
jgi:hypothetical protein